MKFKASLAGLLCMLICAHRFPHRIAQGFLWAEDGAVFIREAAQTGIGAFWTPYAGYLHTVPRLIASGWLALAAPEQFPRGFAWTCLVCYGFVGAAVFALSRRHFSSGWRGDLGALAVAAMPFLVPQSPEIFVNVTNLQWFLAFALAIVLLDLCAGIDSFGRRACSFLFAATGPFGVMLLPLVVCGVACFASRSRLSVVRSLIPYFAACGLQVWAYATSHAPRAAPSFAGFPWLADWLRGALYEVFWPHVVMADAPHVRQVAVILCAGALACLNGRRAARVALPLFVLATAFWFIGVVRQGTPEMLMHWSGYGARYVFLPELCMTVGLLFALFRGTTRIGRAAALVLFAGMMLKPAVVWSPHDEATLVIRDGDRVRVDFPPARTLSIDVRR